MVKLKAYMPKPEEGVVSIDEALGFPRPDSSAEIDQEAEFERSIGFAILDEIGIKNGNKVTGKVPGAALADRLGFSDKDVHEHERATVNSVLSQFITKGFVKMRKFPTKSGMSRELTLSITGKNLYLKREDKRKQEEAA